MGAAILSAALAVSAAAVTAAPVYADHSITITNADNDQATHQYVAYQVFQGELAAVEGSTDGEKQLINIEWGDGVQSDKLLVALKASDAFGTPNPFADCDTAAKVAVELEKFAAYGAEANAFADIVRANLGTTSYQLPDQKVPDAGYYFILDTITQKPDSNTQYAYSDHILRVVKDTDLDNITAKTSVPSIEKKIGETFADGKKTSTASIGDSVPFVLESKVPDMSMYNDYYFIVNDTLSEGLTFNNNVAITVGGHQLNKDSDYQVVTSGVSPYTFQIVFKNFYEQLYLNNTPDDTTDDGRHTGETITITYSATLNEKAKITAEGNPNKVDLTFSNNPNHKYEGGDKPTDEEKNDDVIGKTPESSTKTFTTGLKLIKKDAATQKALEGAKFQITGEGVKAVLIDGEIYKEAADGTYYMLKDGTFTTTAPTEETKAKYDSDTVKYKKISTVTKDTASATKSVNQTAYSNDKGIITFTGLDAGTYTLTELAAPDGYNKLSESITIVIAATLDDKNQTCSWSVTKAGTNLSIDNSLYQFEVENNKGMTLPSTGGIGTTIFYVIGGLFITGGIVLLVTKKRMNMKEK